MTGRISNNMKKRPYKKPQIEEIRLIADEVVLVGCKVTQGAGGPIGKCNAHPSSCLSSLGS
ncbi:MAG TPA: hypothetical protein DCP92_07080 [Nitrospiraceae bacterium]|jgi:hypothetical protein|nr:hypothetical protein [Nitrospiraceae bacterium]